MSKRSLLADVANHLSAAARQGDARALRLVKRMRNVNNNGGDFPGGQVRGQVPSHGRTAAYGRPLPDRLLRVPGTTTLAPGGISGALPVQWPCKAKVFGILYAVTEGTPAAFSGITMELEIQGTKAIFTDGFTEAFGHLASAALPGVFSPAAQYPIDINVTNGEPWQITLKNEGTVAATPIIQFAFWELHPNERARMSDEDVEL